MKAKALSGSNRASFTSLIFYDLWFYFSRNTKYSYPLGIRTYSTPNESADKMDIAYLF